MTRFILSACFLLCALALSSQDSNRAAVSVYEKPPEVIPAGICTQSAASPPIARK
jgi:hypothetical protein